MDNFILKNLKLCFKRGYKGEVINIFLGNLWGNHNVIILVQQLFLGRKGSCDMFSFSSGVPVDLNSRFQLGGMAFIKP